MERITETIAIEGMSCGHCVQAVKRSLERIEGIDVHEVAIGTARISYDPDRHPHSEITEAVEDAGFNLVQS